MSLPEIESPSLEAEDCRPPRRIIGGYSASWLIPAASGLFLLMLAAALWYTLAPLSLARLIGRLADRPLNIEGLALTVERRHLEIPSGGAVVITPRENISLGPLVSSRWLNYDLSLISPDFDLAAVTGGRSASAADFLDSALFRPTAALRLEALDKGRPVAEFNILVQYEARDYAAWAHMTEDPARRAEIFGKILELDPNFPGADEELAASLIAAGRLAEASALCQDMLGRRPAEAGAEILIRLLALYETTGDDSGRLDALKALAAILPDGPDKASAWKAIGLMSVRAGDYGPAAAAYQAALNLEPEDGLTRLNLARVQNLAGHRLDYRAGLSELAARFPDDYREELAEALREDGLWPEAQAQYQALVEARPDNLSARLILMELMEKNQDQDGLLAQYAILTALQPDDQVALYNYGALLFERKEWNEAALAFQKLLGLNASDARAREYLLALYQSQGKNAEMLEQALALYRLDPSQVVYRTFVLNTYENAKDWRHFTEAAAECAALRPDDPEAWRQLARGQAKLNQKQEAAQSLGRAAEAETGAARP